MISGLTGLGVVLLHRNTQPELLRDVLAYLVRLTEPITADGEQLPGWWSGDGPFGCVSSEWPGGHATLGIAPRHHWPARTAGRRGITAPRHTKTISCLLDWLDNWRVGTGRSAWWTGMISRAEHHTNATRASGPQRPSWCYGTPGLARA
ncbi:hypothetical protein [Lentzea flava]|uniref:Lanthionine synthetase C-like protein n=1 Tax=Lentzea flava TaxID=103732 RepID=A0ABQ2UL50_9PSEU|nr:hypothetical protein [Lentzea flava]GGU43049.1 hypothetical protein GCM10010178_39660 [Lentzea flava]